MSNDDLLEEVEERPKEEAEKGLEKGEKKVVGVSSEIEERLEADEQPKPEKEIKKRVVVVDSNDKALDRTISALRKGSYTVIGVESTAECLNLMNINAKDVLYNVNPDVVGDIYKNKPDLLITDIDLKDLDGWEFIFRLKSDNRYHAFMDVPIIVLSEEPITVETVTKLQSESIHDYISKSVKGKELLQKIDNYFLTREKLSEKKNEIRDVLGYAVASEYERISLAVRILLKYINGLKIQREGLKKEGEGSEKIRQIQDQIHLKNRDLIRYERRRWEIKKTLKAKKVERGDEANVEGD